MDRRVYLGLVGTAAIAGCIGGGGDSDANGNDTDGTDGQTDDSSDDASDGDNGTAENGTQNGNENQDEDTDEDSPVAFELSWDHFVETTSVTSGRNFGADASPDGVFLGAEWGFRGLALSDGSTLWNNTEWDGFIDIHADTNGVIAYTNSFEVVSIDPQSGSENWRETTDSSSEDTYLLSAMASSYIAIQGANGVTVFDRATGDVIADVSEVPEVLLVTDDAMVISTLQEAVVYDLPSGEERWRNPFTLSFGSVVHDGRIVGVGYAESFDAPNQIRAIDLASGEEEWSVSTGESGIGGPTLATENDVGLFVYGSLGEGSTVQAHDLTDGTKLWSDSLGNTTPSFTPPATDSGVAIVPAVTENNMAELWAYDVQSGEKVATTGGGISATEGLAVDRTFLEIGLTDVTAHEF